MEAPLFDESLLERLAVFDRQLESLQVRLDQRIERLHGRLVDVQDRSTGLPLENARRDPTGTPAPVEEARSEQAGHGSVREHSMNAELAARHALADERYDLVKEQQAAVASMRRYLDHAYTELRLAGDRLRPSA